MRNGPPAPGLDAKLYGGSQVFRRTMFKRIIPNLKRIGLLSDRVRPLYAGLGVLGFEHGKAATELSAQEMLAEEETG